MPKPLTARIEVFRPGTFTPMQGEPITYSVADLRAIADGYDPATAPAPIVVGHPDTDAPAYGWVSGFEYDADEERLFAVLDEIEPDFAELVKTGRFKKVSMAFFSPAQSHNPVPGTWYPKHVGFLGAAAPAVPGLKNAAFAGKADTVFTAEFGRGFEETASLMRALRDFFIDRFGLEDADRVLPSYRIEWLSELDDDMRDGLPSFASRGFKSPLPKTPTPEPQPKPEITVPKDPDPNFAAREASLAEREKVLAARETAARHDENVSFAERLVEQGRLLPASRDKVVAIFDALPTDQSVAFSEGAAKLTPAAALREVLEAQPAAVTFGAADLPDGPGSDDGKAVEFASDGKSVDPTGLELHNKALAYQRQHPGTAYIAAVHAVS